MSKKRISLFLSLLIMGSLILAACAPAPQPATEPPTPQPQPTAEVIIQTVEVPIEVEAFPDGTELKILQWSHFVPQYDVWFDPFAKVGATPTILMSPLTTLRSVNYPLL